MIYDYYVTLILWDSTLLEHISMFNIQSNQDDNIIC